MANTKELYNKYFSVIVEKFYSVGEKRKLLGLFAASCGVAESSPEFAKVSETIESIELIGIESLTDCMNFLLVADSLPGKRELIKAVKAARACFENHRKSGQPTYADVIEWRTAVYQKARTDAAAKLDAAYIEYARGLVDKSMQRFEQLVDEASHLPSVEHLALINRKLACHDKALFWFLVLEEVLSSVLRIDCPDYVTEAINEEKAALTDEEIADLTDRAHKKVKRAFGDGESTKCNIGFQPRG